MLKPLIILAATESHQKCILLKPKLHLMSDLVLKPKFDQPLVYIVKHCWPCNVRNRDIVFVDVAVVILLFVVLIVYNCRCAACPQLARHSGETEPLLPRAEPTYTGL